MGAIQQGQGFAILKTHRASIILFAYSAGTKAPDSIMGPIILPISVSFLTSSLKRSPVEIWTIPYLPAIMLHLDPLPEPGGPQNTKTFPASLAETSSLLDVKTGESSLFSEMSTSNASNIFHAAVARVVVLLLKKEKEASINYPDVVSIISACWI